MSEAWLFWIAWLAKSSVVVILAWCVAAALRALRLAASARHRVWLSAIVVLALMPVLAQVLPPVELPLSYAQLGISAPSLTTPGVHQPTRETASRVGAAYLTGVGLLLLQMVVARIALERHWRHAVKSLLPDGDACARLAGVVGQAEVRIASHPIAPLTWGRQVLLPSNATQWSEERTRDVLLHEFMHIARRDSLTQSLATLVRAVFWFSPLVWIACRELRRGQEQACDEAVMARGAESASYARTLLEIAADSGFRTLQGSSPAVAQRSALESRIENILNPRCTRQFSRQRMAVLTTSMLLAGGIVAAVAPVDLGRRLGPLAPPAPMSSDGPSEALEQLPPLGTVLDMDGSDDPGSSR